MVKYKFQVGDKVVGTGKDYRIPNGQVFTVVKIWEAEDDPYPYELDNCEVCADEDEIRPLNKLERALS